MPLRDVFIIMPFGEQKLFVGGEPITYCQQYFDDVYAIICDAVSAYDSSINVSRMEQQHGNLVAAIIRRLQSADLVIAVLAGKNANVFYELGIRHSLRLNTLMLVETRAEYPFDLTSYFSHQYSIAHETDRRALRAFIAARLAECAAGALPDSPVLDVLQQAEVEQFRILNAWETRRAVVILDGLVREILSLNALAHDVLDTDAANPSEFGRPIRLTCHVLDGFTKTRPIPGLPTQAYREAEAVYRDFELLARSWNDLLATTDPDAREEAQLAILAECLCRTIGFLYDVTAALDFVMRERRAYDIPWHGAYSTLYPLRLDDEVVIELEKEIASEANAVLDRFWSFERDYVGVPRQLQEEVRTQSTVRDFDILLQQARTRE